MDKTITKDEAATVSRTETRETGEGLRKAQGCFLSELPGAVFAVVTLVWIAFSFAGLVWATPGADLVRKIAELAHGHPQVLSSTLGVFGKQVLEHFMRRAA